VPEVVFEAVSIGQTFEVTVPIENVGDAPLTLTRVDVVEQDPIGAPELELETPWVADAELVPGAVARVVVSWTPSDSAADLGALELETDTGDVLSVPLRTPELFGRLTFDNTLEFGDIPLNERVSRLVELTNSGEGELLLRRVWLESKDSAFSLAFADGEAPEDASRDTTDAPTSLAPGESMSIRVSVDAERPGALRDVLFVASSDPGALERRLIITANPEDPCVRWEGSINGVLDLGDVVVGRAEGETLRLRNCSALTSMRVDDVSFTAQAEIFTLEGLDALADTLPRTLAPGQSLGLELTYTPEEVGSSTAQLRATVQLDRARTEPLTILGAGVPNQCPIGAIDSRAAVEDGATAAMWSREPVAFTTFERTLKFSSQRSRDLDGMIQSAQWSITERPLGSTAQLDLSTNMKQPRLTPDALGEYVVELTVFDDLGLESCVAERITVEVVRDDDLVVELTWNTPGDMDPGDAISADLDIHLRHPEAMMWEDDFLDVYWRNLSPDWGIEGDVTDDPKLFGDDRGEDRRELLVFDNITSGLEYQIAVHVKNGANQFDLGPSIARVRVFSQGELLYQKERGEMYDDSFWAVGRFQWPSGRFFAQDLYYVELPGN